MLNGPYDNASATFYHSRAYIQVVKRNNFEKKKQIKFQGPKQVNIQDIGNLVDQVQLSQKGA